MKMTKPNFDRFTAEQLCKDTQISPSNDLWPGIEKAINHQPTMHNKGNLWAKISAIAACVFVGVFSWQMLVKPEQQNTLAAMSDFFEQQKRGLLVHYQSQPALTINWQSQLQQLEEAEQAVKLALQNNPENAALINMLAQVYQQQLALINKVHTPIRQKI